MNENALVLCCGLWGCLNTDTVLRKRIIGLDKRFSTFLRCQLTLILFVWHSLRIG